jgi:hypothetical protein
LRFIRVVLFAFVALATGVAIASAAASKPVVKLVCVSGPCGTNPQKNTYNGTYLVEQTYGFPADTKVVITAIYPDGEPYPADQYSDEGTVNGVTGNVETTNSYGQLPDFKWQGYNGNKPVDPDGEYLLFFHIKKGSGFVITTSLMRIYHIPH